MTSHTTDRFRKAFAGLPKAVQQQARHAYRLFREDPAHPSLRFKQVHSRQPVFSARVGLGYRALSVREGDAVVWFWIGTHGDYDQLLRTL